jgi:hypothetical protein
MATMTQPQLDAQTQSGALIQVDPSICASGYSQAIGGCLQPVPATGINWGNWLIGALIIAGIGWYFRADIMQFVEARWPK